MSPSWLPMVCAITVAGCCNHGSSPHGTITGSVTLDGQPQIVTSCEVVPGAEGVDLMVANGAKIRLVKELDGRSVVLLFPPDASVAKNLGGCVDLNLITKSREKGSPYTEGKAVFKCSTGEDSIEGTVEFKSCGFIVIGG